MFNTQANFDNIGLEFHCQLEVKISNRVGMAEGTRMKQLEACLDAVETSIRHTQEQLEGRFELVELGLCQTQEEVSRGRVENAATKDMIMTLEKSVKAKITDIRGDVSSLK